MKIKIINTGGYVFGGTLKLPVIVEAVQYDTGFDVKGSELIKYDTGFDVKGSELIKHGASIDIIDGGFEYFFQPNYVCIFEEAEVRDIDVNISFTDVKHCKAIRQGDQMQCVCGLAWDIDDTDLPECRV
jgi:hypothetical protein